MNKVISFIVWSLAAYIIYWAIQFTFEQNVTSKVENSNVQSMVRSDENIRTLLSEENPIINLNELKSEAELNVGENFTVSLGIKDGIENWNYNVADKEIVDKMGGDILNPDSSKQVFAFKAKKSGVTYIIFDNSSNEIKFKIIIR